MKKIILIFSLILLMAMQANSQGFQFYRVGNFNVYGDTSSLNPVAAHFVLKNTSASSLNFKLVRVVNAIPATWTTSICCLLGCLPSFVDTIPPFGYTGHYTLSAGAVDSVLVDFQGNTIGNGRVVLRAFVESAPGTFIQDSVKVYLNAPGGINQISTLVNNYELKQNYPNPFNPTTSITFSVPKSTFVTLKVFDIMGREVANLVNGQLSQGSYRYDLNTEDYNLTSGVYFYQLNAGGFTETKKMLLIK